MADVEKGEPDGVEIQAPKWALWGGKALALLASFSWAFGSIWNFLHILNQWNCAVAGVLALLFAISVWCVEAAVLVTWGPCMPVTGVIAEKTAAFKVWQKACFHFVGGMTTYFFCTSSAAANAFGFVMTIGASSLYGYAVYNHRKATGDLC